MADVHWRIIGKHVNMDKVIYIHIYSTYIYIYVKSAQHIIVRIS